MNVLIIGSGGREHTLAWKIAQSPKLSNLYVMPGNAGTAGIAVNIPGNPADFENIKKIVIENHINMVVVGPEDPLAKGIHDFFLADESLCHVQVVGPVQEGALLEGSKAFAKRFMQKYHIPTALHKSFTRETVSEGIVFLKKMTPPFVLKADGLAAGKGVLIMHDLDEAIAEFKSMLEGKFGDASENVIIEEFMEGIELSVFILTDGESYVLLPEAKDYKKIGEGDTGLNTGGMGAVSPVPFANKEFMQKVEETIIKPTIQGLQSEGIPYCGFLFFGLISVNGDPFVIEYNARMGDPEAEVVIPRIQNDLIDLFQATCNKQLHDCKLEINGETTTTVMLVSGGYPQDYDKGKRIENIEKCNDSIIFHAGTRQENGSILTNGGRVLAVSSFGSNMTDALNKCYTNANLITFEGKYYRPDIGFDL